MEIPGRTKPQMVPKRRARKCHNCNERLIWLFSKKHCEVCGQVCCTNCCQKEIPLVYKDLEEGRICNGCFHAGFAHAHVLIIWLRYLGMIAMNCGDCGQKFTFGKKTYGCLTCEQTICDRCIPLEAIGKLDVVRKCRRCECRGKFEGNMTLLRMEEDMKRIGIQLIFLVADRLDVHNKRLNTAETALSSIGLVGGTLALTGFGLSFATFGTSLILTVTGGAIGGAAGVGQVSAQVSKYLIKNKLWKRLKVVSRRIIEVKEKRWKLDVASTFSRTAGTAGGFASTIKTGVKLSNVADDVTAAAQTAATTGKLATKTVSKTLFSSLSKTGKVFHFAGAVFSVAGMGFDTYTIIDRCLKLSKKQPAEAAENMRRLGYRLMGPIPYLPSVCERRLVDRELSHQRTLF